MTDNPKCSTCGGSMRVACEYSLSGICTLVVKMDTTDIQCPPGALADCTVDCPDCCPSCAGDKGEEGARDVLADGCEECFPNAPCDECTDLGPDAERIAREALVRVRALTRALEDRDRAVNHILRVAINIEEARSAWRLLLSMEQVEKSLTPDDGGGTEGER